MSERRITLFQLPPYRVARLGEAHLDSLQRLLERCPDYFGLVEGRAVRAEEAAGLLADCPPERSPVDKLLLGFFTDRQRLAGILDAVPDYPVPGTWFVGLLLLDPADRGHGLGHRICRAFEAWVRSAGASRIDLGVVEANAAAARFWERQGFRRVERRPSRRFGLREHAVEVWRRDLIGD